MEEVVIDYRNIDDIFDYYLYYNPEKWGLEQVAMLDYSTGSYEFDYRVVWRSLRTGKYYTARDRGCSCPVPFENYKQVSQLEPYSFETVALEVMKAIEEKKKEDWYYGNSNLESEGMQFLDTLRMKGIK